MAISEIRKRNPLAVMVAYTALGPLDRRYRQASGLSDEIVRKLPTPDNLTTKLDTIILALNSPKSLWQRIRTHLFNLGFDTKDVAVIEHYFCKSLDNKDPNYFAQKISRIYSNEDLKALAENALPPLIKGALSIAV